jgi:hypothetical protein
MPNVNVACGLPRGLTLEVGAANVLKNGELSSTYASAQLVGFLDAGKKAVSFPNKKGQKFGVASVDADLWAAWLAKNKTLRYVVEGSVFVVP